MLLLLLALSAPAPLPKPMPKPPALSPASYSMTWRGIQAPTHFHADGFYSCHWQGTWWHGSWSQEKGVLTVTEWPVADPHRPATWAVTLSCPRSGRHAGGTPWGVAPLAGPVN